MNNHVVVEIFYFDAGGGHRAAMTALRDVLEQQSPAWTVRPVDLQKLLEPADPVHRITGRVNSPLKKLMRPVLPRIALGPVQSQTVYNAALRSGATYGFDSFLSMLKSYIRKNSGKMESLLRRHWDSSEDGRPDLVVSVIPNFNGVIYRALRQVRPDVPYMTIMTDLVDCPPRFWMEDQDQVMICGTNTAAQQARATGYYAPENIFQVSGMILRQEFYVGREHHRRLTHLDLGLSPDRPTALIMFGGNGSRASRRIVDQIGKIRPDMQTIVMCGRSAALQASLRGKAGCHAVGFTHNVADYMRLADFLIGKPGPGSISEAIHMGCPVIVECNAATMPQERPNVEWVVEHGVGIAVKNLNTGIAAAMTEITDSLAAYKLNINRNVARNQAVFEIAAIVRDVVQAHRSPTWPSALSAPPLHRGRH